MIEVENYQYLDKKLVQEITEAAEDFVKFHAPKDFKLKSFKRFSILKNGRPEEGLCVSLPLSSKNATYTSYFLKQWANRMRASEYAICVDEHKNLSINFNVFAKKDDDNVKSYQFTDAEIRQLWAATINYIATMKNLGVDMDKMPNTAMLLLKLVDEINKL